MKKVLIPTKLDPVAATILEGQGDYQVVQDAKTPLADLLAAHPDTYALIVRSEKIGENEMTALPGLKVILRAGAGYNTIDTKAARARGIDVMNTPGANANAVAEEVIAMMLADARHLVAADASVRAGEWEKSRFMGRELAGKTLGILGLGYIGQLLARRLRGFEMTLLGYDPVISEERARELGIRLVPAEELFEQADYVSLHLPENEQTQGLVDRDLLERMKEGATLINCARAGIVNEADLREVKPRRKLRFLNDVYPKDAPGPKPIADLCDLMLPHLGASTAEANQNAARRAAEQLVEFDTKGITSYIVNRDIPAGLDEAYGELAHVLARLARAVLGDDAALDQVETSFYGNLKPYANWLTIPIVSALARGFDRSLDYAAARQYLHDQGIAYEDRVTDDSKGYANSITVDLVGRVGPDESRHVSVRGTVAESTLMIARINDFDKLYFEPTGHLVAYSYEDRPGVLGCIAAALAEAGINIDDVRNPHDSQGRQSLAILKVNQPVPEAVVERIAERVNAKIAFGITID